MASQLSDDTIKSLADYCASQKPLPGVPGDSALMAEGQKIYAQGIPAKNVQACAICHGPKAEGAASYAASR